MGSIDGFLFDMDGVLVNSEELKGVAHAYTVGRLGGEGSADWYRDLMGRGHEVVIAEFMRRGGVRALQEEYDELYHARYAQLLRENGRLTPGTRPLHEDLVRAGIPAALVSSSARWMIEEVLDMLGIRDWFRSTVSADDVTNPKPDPEPYRLALGHLNVDPSRTAILEDSESGVQAGVAAGCRVFALRHELNGGHDFAPAVAVFDHIPRLAEMLERL